MRLPAPFYAPRDFGGCSGRLTLFNFASFPTLSVEPSTNPLLPCVPLSLSCPSYLSTAVAYIVDEHARPSVCFPLFSTKKTKQNKTNLE
jgi:hypothetical protein